MALDKKAPLREARRQPGLQSPAYFEGDCCSQPGLATTLLFYTELSTFALASMMFKLQQPEVDFIATARHRFTYDVTLSTTPELSFEVVASGKHEQHWFPGFRRTRWIGEKHCEAGGIRRYELSYMTLIEHFTTWRPGAELSFWVSQCSLPLLDKFMERYELRGNVDGTTQLRWTVCYAPNRWLAPLHPLVRPYFARDFRSAADQLVGYCQRLAGASSVPGAR